MVEVMASTKDDPEAVSMGYSSIEVTPIEIFAADQTSTICLSHQWLTTFGSTLSSLWQTARHCNAKRFGIINGLLIVCGIVYCNTTNSILASWCCFSQELIRFLLPLLFILSASAWISWYINRCHLTECIPWLITLTAANEIVLRCFSVNHSLSLNLTAFVLLTSGTLSVSYTDMNIKDEYYISYISLTVIAAYRLVYCHLLSSLLSSQTIFSSIIPCLSSIFGLCFAKFWCEPFVLSDGDSDIATSRGNKITVIRRGNSSLDSAMPNHHSPFITSPIRRTSLPALGLPTRRVSFSSMDLTTLGEVHGMISDIMVDSSLTPNVAGTLRIVADMISPLLKNTFQRHSFSSPLVTVLEKTTSQLIQNQDSVRDQPDIKDDTPLSFKHRLQQQLGSRSRRMSNSYTTTTSASGMPSIDHHRRQPSGSEVTPIAPSTSKASQRAKSFAGIRTSSLSDQRKENFKSFSFSHQSSPLMRSDSGEKPKIVHQKVVIEEAETEVEKSDKGNFKSRIGGPKVSLDNVALEPLTEDDAPPEVDVTTTTETTATLHHGNLLVATVAPVRKTSRDETAQNRCGLYAADSGIATGMQLVPVDVENEKKVAESVEIASLMVDVLAWEFPVFELHEKCNVLTQLAYYIFQRSGFFNTFKLDVDAFLRFFRCLESGYHEIPYHNRIHASDVLHGVHFLTNHRIPGFKGLAMSSSRRTSSGSESDGVNEECDNIDTYGCLADVIPDLELMALYTAAAMHDYDHPGRTNAFLVATLDAKALLYNDRSVLENHHAASSWSMLVSDPNLNFLADLEPREFKRFRFIVIEEILSTDLKKHFDFMTDWGAKISGCGGFELDWENESDRLLVGEMCIKLADISGPAKSWDLHCRWTDRIVSEFYLQGDDEKTRGMPVSPYMDRNHSTVPQLQESFIKHLVGPLYDAYMQADIMPGKWGDPSEVVSQQINTAPQQKEENTNDDEIDRELRKTSEANTNKRVPVHEIMNNINSNHQQWIRLIAESRETELSNTKQALAQPSSAEVKVEHKNGSLCNGKLSIDHD